MPSISSAKRNDQDRNLKGVEPPWEQLGSGLCRLFHFPCLDLAACRAGENKQFGESPELWNGAYELHRLPAARAWDRLGIVDVVAHALQSTG
jgi:hypothetical protein